MAFLSPPCASPPAAPTTPTVSETLRWLTGSRAYGLALSDSDTDLRSVIPPGIEDYLRLARPRDCVDQNGSDTVAFGLHHAVDMIQAGGPNIIEIFADDAHILGSDELGDMILALKPFVLTTLPVNGNGDFRSRESVAFLDMSDIVCTNPPFSLFREYVAQIVEHGKGFLIMGNMNAVTYKEIFPLIKDGRLWAGSKFNKCFEYRVPDSYPLTGNKCRQDENGVKYVTVPAIAWYTNLDHPKRHRPLDLFRRYTPERYPEYDNYSAINVDKVADIPEDYMGPMGVPISFLDKWCPEQFEILGFWNAGTAGEALGARMTEAESGKRLIIWNGPTVARKTKYFRIIIRRVI